ncbi:T9SS type A sorting domain-containing protein [Flavobacterium psychroterrae]|uniref:T9SS type A sorting domain-containing protein n=1 Tax=Flavobacterium psychroterrae TaxID=2133767 RepID=A0ABS5P5A3_9FLAO|nr:T9SS type A sorting domain-containing protein [Flavobacterium psychroterrae]MBS7229458.1 T9SS type A sorting domain-containing protein [Flavobacterium psychroterrae]
MKKLYLLLIFLFFGMQYITAQTTETFDTATVGAANFTNASKTFNLTSSYGVFTVFNGAGQGYGGTNRFIQVSDSAGPEALGQFGTITAAAGSFKVSNFWIYLSGDSNQNAGVTSNGAAGSVTFTGKLAGVTQFTVVKTTSGANIGYTLPGNGFVYTNFVTDGAADYTNVVIDQLVIQLSANYDYFAIDSFTFANGAVAPTVTTTAATAVKAVSATIGGNVTEDGGDATIERGIVWATTTNPTILSNKVQIGTGTGAFTNTVTGFPPASLIYYRAYATNSGGTSYGAQLTLTTNAGLGTAATGQSNVSCFGGSNGTATVIANGGGAPYTYLWTNGATTATASGLGVGPISVNITDSELSQITRNFTITQPSTIVGTPSVTNVSCNGGSNGTATITATGGTPGYTYLWSNGAITATTTGLLAGTYSVTITDDNSCTRTVNNIIVTQPAVLNGTPSVTNVSCFGGSNGTATITASGGTGSRTYLWSNGATTATASGLTAGTYSVTVTDANSCTRTVSNIIVGTPSASVSGTASTTPVSCFGGSNGTATVTPGGGTPGYTYLWSNGATTATATGLIAGTYSVTITDANSCTGTISNIVVGGPSAIISATPSTTSVSCFGGSNGTATIVASGGTPGYTYLWSNGATTATASGLLAGTYFVTITDANSCTRTVTNIVVGTPAVINAVPTQVNVSCNGGTNGSATVTPTGGTGGFTYLWSNGTTTNSITDLTQGTYSVTIKDANTCQVTQNFTITQPAVLAASQGTINNVSCNGGSNGSATVVTTGGTPGYTYLWSPTGGTGATASGLIQGTYTVTVTDSKLCQTTQTFTITEPTPFAVTTSQNDILCNGSATGSATVNVTGGTGTYTYLWSPAGGTAATATGLTAGTYTVTITDANTCSTTRNFTITQPSALIATPVAMTNIGCRGDATGSATVSASGGTGTYTYSWSPLGGNAATASGLTAGTYTVTVTDANLCQTTQNFTITQPAAILSASTASTGVSCFGGSNGTASVTVSGGTPGYTYSWAPLGGTSSLISGRPAGNYTCTITDANGCTLVKNITISTPAQFSATVSQTNVSCNGGSNGSATITPSGATAPYSYSWSPSGGNAATASGLVAGTYTVTVQDANTCVYTQSVTITEPSTFTVTPSQTNVSCNGGSNGSASVAVSGATPGYTYVWLPSGGTAAAATGLTTGNYTVLITDANGCTYTQNFTITEPAVLNASTSQINATCVIGGQASVTPVGGTAPYTYSWLPNGETTQTVTGLAAGNYSVLITDDNGCTIVKNFTIGSTNTLVATTSQTDVSCNGGSNGSLTVVPSGAPGPFTYVWSPTGGTEDTASNLTAGNYSVTITSANGCSTVKNFTINEPAAIVVTPSQTNVACNGDVSGSASVNVTGGTAPYTYAWSPSGGTADTATGLSAGTYTVTITDDNSCQTTQSFTITEPTLLIATTTASNVSCNGANDGTAIVNATGGTGTYTYVWSPTGGTADTATGLAAGTYTIEVTDSNSCTTTQVVTITEPLLLDATTAQIDVTCTGGNDGEAIVTATGGTVPYTYLWSNGATTATASGLTAGNYTVTITDANACTVTKPVTIITNPDILAPVPDVTNLPDITNYCSILSAEIAIPTATDVCAGIVNATTTDPLTYNAVGTYVITWTYDDGNGNTSFQTQTLHVVASPLNLVTFSNAEVTYNGNVQALQVANLPAGATVAYSITPAGSTANGAINVGVYTVTAIVSPSASSANCSPVTLTAQLTIKKAAQVITFAPIPPKTLGAVNTFNLEASSNSGLAIRYSYTYISALPPANVSAVGAVDLLRSGELLIVAHQDGNANYLPAADVSQVLVIKNNDVSITKITLGNTVYQNPAKDIKYVLACGENNLNVAIVNETNATITPSANFAITPPKPGIYTQNVKVTSQDGSATANYTITVEKPFGFYDIVHQKFNNVLIVNNNPQTNGGYEFVSYQWFKNGQLIGTGQYYSAGDDLANSLDKTADYSVKMTTKDGKVLSTCSTKITTQKTLSAKLYPNPIQAGKVITIEADYPQEELDNMQISLYSVSGQLVNTIKSSSVITEIQLPDAESNMYIVVIETPNIKKTLKVIVNK